MEFNIIYIKKTPLLLRGGKRSKTGTACGYHTAPIADAMQRIPPNIGGNKQSKIGGGMWVSHHPHHLGCKKERPPMIGGVKRNEIGAVWLISHRRW